jgi:hypothetical protein
MTAASPQKKLIPWESSGKKSYEARIWCPKCGMSKIITRYENAFWEKENMGCNLTAVCDACREPIKYRVTKDGVEINSN